MQILHKNTFPTLQDLIVEVNAALRNEMSINNTGCEAARIEAVGRIVSAIILKSEN